jgi:hypothetical protein
LVEIEKSGKPGPVVADVIVKALPAEKATLDVVADSDA